MRFPRSMQAASSSVWTLLIAGLVLSLSIVAGSYFFMRGKSIMEQELRENLRTTATVAAQLFNAERIESIHDIHDRDSTDFREIVQKLENIRRTVPNIRYAYLMRQSEKPLTPVFIADADSLATPEELDKNGDGNIDEQEQASYPGDSYDATNVPALQGEAFREPSVDAEITVDPWGALLSGYAPIRRSDGKVVATLGLDMRADDYLRLSQRLFSPIALLLFIFAGSSIASIIFLYLRKRHIAALEQIDAERSALIALASHELGTPLSIFKWWTEILRDHENQAMSASQGEICTQLEEGIARMEQVVSTLREARSMSEGTVRYTPGTFSLRSILENVVKEFEARLEKKQQRIEISFEHREDRMHLDGTLMTGVIRELLENASQYSPTGKTIVIRTKQTGRSVEISMEDHGCGIPARDLPRLFQKLTRGSNASTFKPHGSGMGLFLARTIIEKAGGTIAIASTEGKGTTVTVRLPLRR